ncbi:MAG TPA: hypothetical protein GX507_06940 [Clostridia bacterium]|nr:hypothetical protein [Clostridia bacterium]
MGATALLLIGILILVALGVLYWAMKERRRIELLEGGEKGEAASRGDETIEIKPKESEEGAPLQEEQKEEEKEEERKKEAHFEEEPVEGSEVEETEECEKGDESEAKGEEDEHKAPEVGQMDVKDLPGIHENPETADDSQRALG